MLSKLHLIEQKISQKQLRVLLIAMAILTILRLISVFWSPYSLQVDEAQYAGWARSFSAGYYSKPPFIAWILGVGQTVCSTLNIHQVEGCTRMLQAPALFIASLFIMASAWQLFEEYAITLLSGLIFITLPFVGFYSLVATTDAWLLMWWSIAFFSFVFAIKNPNVWWPWWVCGIAVGLGSLTKYAMLMFIISAGIALYQLERSKDSKLNLKALFSLLIALLVFSPNILWNISTGFPTLEHHIEISHLNSATSGAWEFKKAVVEFLSFFLAQFIVFGPLTFLSLILASLLKKAKFNLPQKEIQAMQCLRIFTWPMLFLILFQAFMSRAFSNWAVVAYVSGSILVASFWVLRIRQYVSEAIVKKLVFASIVFGLLCTIFMIAVPHWLASSAELRVAKLNPLRKLEGWKEVALWTKSYLHTKPMRVITDDRYLLAELSTYAYPEAYPPLSWNPSRHKDNHYNWFYDLANANQKASGTMLLILTNQPAESEIAMLKASFEDVLQIKAPALSAINIGGTSRNAYAFEVRNFRGYP